MLSLLPHSPTSPSPSLQQYKSEVRELVTAESGRLLEPPVISRTSGQEAPYSSPPRYHTDNTETVPLCPHLQHVH